MKNDNYRIETMKVMRLVNTVYSILKKVDPNLMQEMADKMRSYAVRSNKKRYDPEIVSKKADSLEHLKKFIELHLEVKAHLELDTLLNNLK